MDFWIMNEDGSVEAVESEGYYKWFQGADRAVRKSYLKGLVVSTVFLGLDHNFGVGEPLLFETMVFPKEDDGTIDYDEMEMDRYSTYQEAVDGHELMVELCMDKYVN